MAIRRNGFTLQEMLVVVTIIIILFLLALMAINPKAQLQKSHDAVRKTDINKIRVAMESYYTDYDCYPTQEQLNTCGGEGLSPYLERIPCDPVSKQPYHLEYIPSVCPQQYAVMTNLEYTQDPSIERVGCTAGCGQDHNYNYLVLSGDATSATFTPTTTPTPTPTPSTPPTPTPTPQFYCSDTGDCTLLQSGYTCPGYQLFENPVCSDPPRSCLNSAYICTPTKF